VPRVAGRWEQPGAAASIRRRRPKFKQPNRSLHARLQPVQIFEFEFQRTRQPCVETGRRDVIKQLALAQVCWCLGPGFQAVWGKSTLGRIQGRVTRIKWVLPLETIAATGKWIVQPRGRESGATWPRVSRELISAGRASNSPTRGDLACQRLASEEYRTASNKSRQSISVA
jgi:hypothetical protein